MYDDEDECAEECQMSPLEMASVMLHEMYLSLITGGFTPDEALRIVAHLITEIDQTDEYET